MGFACRPKKESRIELAELPAFAALAKGLLGRMPALSELLVDTEAFTAAMTTRANEMPDVEDRKSTRLNSSHSQISYAVFCLKKKSTSLAYPRVAPRNLRP